MTPRAAPSVSPRFGWEPDVRDESLMDAILATACFLIALAAILGCAVML